MELVIDGTKLSNLYSSFNLEFSNLNDGNTEQFIIKTMS